MKESLVATIPSGRELALVMGGPPCQGFSWAGRRRSNDGRNREVACFAQMVVALRPLAFVMENVRGILTNGIAQLSAATKTLAKVYRVCEPQLLRASDYGVPQARGARIPGGYPSGRRRYAGKRSIPRMVNVLRLPMPLAICRRCRHESRAARLECCMPPTQSHYLRRKCVATPDR